MKKSLRKILLIISTVVLSVVLAACGSKGESNIIFDPDLE